MSFPKTFRNVADIPLIFDINPVICGFPTFEVNDILRKGEPDLIIIAARPGHCKTALGLNLALGAAKMNGGARIYSLEMTAEQMVRRALSIESGQPVDILKKCSKEFIKKLQDRVRSLNLQIDDTNGLDIRGIQSSSYEEHKRNPVNLTIVDYLQIVSSDRKDRRDKVADATRGLKNLAKTIKSPIIALTQLSRQWEQRLSDNPDSPPTMGDIADCADIERFADSIIFLHKPHVDLIKVFCIKNRHGTTFESTMSFEPRTGLIRDLGEKNRSYL